MFGFLKPKRDKLALEIVRNTNAIQRAADAGVWEECSVFAARQDPLLAAYLECSGASEAHLERVLNEQGKPRSMIDPEYQDWICDELLKRGLLPP